MATKGTKRIAARKATERAEEREPSEAQIAALHQQYLALEDVEEITAEDVHPGVRELAKEMGVSPKPAAEAARRGWELERRAAHALRWREEHGQGARTEEEFCVAYAAGHYRHLAEDGVEGLAHAVAIARETWRRIMAPVAVWEAKRELHRAEEAHRKAKERRRSCCQGCHS